MRYTLTPDLMTGNQLIDSEHKELFTAINNLLDACSQGKGRENVMNTAKFLESYVKKHFSDEEHLQVQTKYPGYLSHKTFHDGYKKQISQIVSQLTQEGASMKTLGQINQAAATLMSHISIEDRKLAKYVKENS